MIITAYEISLPDRRVSTANTAKTSNDGIVLLGLGIVHIVN
jgi:hypothetical protein